MREVLRHRPRRTARVLSVAGGFGLAWAGAVLLTGAASDAHADDGIIPDAATLLTPAAGLLPPVPGAVGSVVDELPLPDVIDLPDLPVVPQLPTLPQLPDATPAVDLPETLLPPASPVGEHPTTGTPSSRAIIPSLTPAPNAPIDPPRDARWATPWALDAALGVTPATPTPPTPSQIASGSASVLTPPPADRTSAPLAHFASFPEVSPPGRGPPSDPTHDMDPSPD